jgi:uncharacterized phage protein gp47/JayE
VDFVTRQDLYQIGRDYVLQRASRIDPNQVDVQGSDANIFIGSMAVVSFAIVKQLAFAINRMLLDGAEGEDLDRLAWDRYQQVRKGASAAVTTVNFSRVSAAFGVGTVNQGAVLVTLNNVQYITLQDAAFGAFDLQVNGVPVRATQAGKDYQVGANYITRFQASAFDTTLQVTNPNPAAGGEDREDDDTFRARVREFWNAASRATLAAIVFGAKTVPGVFSASAVEALMADGYPARAVTLYIADSSGMASLVQASAVETALDDWRAAGIAVLVSTSQPQIVSVVLKLDFQAGVDSSTLWGVIRAAVVEYVNSLGTNDPLQRGALFSLLQRYKANGLIINDDAIVEPAGDLVPTPGYTVRTDLPYVTEAA